MAPAPLLPPGQHCAQHRARSITQPILLSMGPIGTAACATGHQRHLQPGSAPCSAVPWPAHGQGCSARHRHIPSAVKREHIEARGRCSDQRLSLIVCCTPLQGTAHKNGGAPPDVTSAPPSSVSLCSLLQPQAAPCAAPSRAGGINQAMPLPRGTKRAGLMGQWSLLSTGKPPKSAGVTVPSHPGHCINPCCAKDKTLRPAQRATAGPAELLPTARADVHVCNNTLRASLVQLFPAASPALTAAARGWVRGSLVANRSCCRAGRQPWLRSRDCSVGAGLHSA